MNNLYAAFKEHLEQIDENPLFYEDTSLRRWWAAWVCWLLRGHSWGAEYERHFVNLACDVAECRVCRHRVWSVRLVVTLSPGIPDYPRPVRG